MLIVVPPTNLVPIVIAVMVSTMAPVAFTVIGAVVMLAVAVAMTTVVGDRHAG